MKLSHVMQISRSIRRPALRSGGDRIQDAGPGGLAERQHDQQDHDKKQDA